MNTKQLTYALVLAQEGSFSKAAEVLNISQPSLSQYIKKIEAQVGEPLFSRTGIDVRLTDAGRVFLEAGQKILKLEREMELKISDISTYKRGSLAIGAAPFRTVTMLPSVVKKFRETYPGMYLDIDSQTTAELMDDMEHGRLDLCLMTLPVDQRQYSSEFVMEEEILLAVPKSYPKIPAVKMDGRRYEAIEASELNGKSFVMITENQLMQIALDNLCEDYSLQVEKAVVVNNLDAQISMVRAGVGCALVPSGMERFCNEDEVQFYSFRENLPRRQVGIIWRKEKVLSEVERYFIDLVKAIAW